MCGIFGFAKREGWQSESQMDRIEDIVSNLTFESVIRGEDSTGIAIASKTEKLVYKTLKSSDQLVCSDDWCNILEKIDKEFSKNQDALKNILAAKLYNVIGGKASKGVKNILGEEVIPRSTKFTKKLIANLDFTMIDPNQWTSSQDNNLLINKIIYFVISYKNSIIRMLYRRRN